MTTAELRDLLREALPFVETVKSEGVFGADDRASALLARIDAALLLAEVERLTVEQDAVHRQGMDRMQQAVIDLLNEHNSPLHLIARVVEMEYP